MNFRTILIVTYGRSGSTLLQGLLNSNPNCVIRGENYNFCYHLFNAYRSLCRAKDFDGELPSSPWFGNALLNERLFLAQAKNLVYKFLNDDKIISENREMFCYGFKEIRYTKESIGNDLEEYLDFLSLIFPDVAFIFNTREHQEVVQSGWWAMRKQEDVFSELKETERNFENYINKNPNNTFHICYEDIIKKTYRLKKMYNFLGLLYEDSLINSVLEKRHSV